MEDTVKIICVELFLIVIGTLGYYYYFTIHNIYALSWGITCSIVFTIFNIFLIIIAIIIKKENKKEGK